MEWGPLSITYAISYFSTKIVDCDSVQYLYMGCTSFNADCSFKINNSIYRHLSLCFTTSSSPSSSYVATSLTIVMWCRWANHFLGEWNCLATPKVIQLPYTTQDNSERGVGIGDWWWWRSWRSIGRGSGGWRGSWKLDTNYFST
jgi:hypothetical protein